MNHVNIRLQAELEEADVPVPPLHTDGTGESTLHEDFLDLNAITCAAERKVFVLTALVKTLSGYLDFFFFFLVAFNTSMSFFKAILYINIEQ